jgi:hypothetical protein
MFIFESYVDWKPAFASFELNTHKTIYVARTINLEKELIVSMNGFRVTSDCSIDDFPNGFFR